VKRKKKSRTEVRDKIEDVLDALAEGELNRKTATDELVGVVLNTIKPPPKPKEWRDRG